MILATTLAVAILAGYLGLKRVVFITMFIVFPALLIFASVA